MKNRERMEIRKEGCIIGRAVCVPAELSAEAQMRESCLFLQTAGRADMSACSSGDHGRENKTVTMSFSDNREKIYVRRIARKGFDSKRE